MPITNEQINLLLAQQAEILITVQSLQNDLQSVKKENKDLKEMMSSNAKVGFDARIRG